MRLMMLGILAAVYVTYALLVMAFGFEGPIALTIHFTRFAVTTAVLITYVPGLKNIFLQLPSPGRDYLLAGIVLNQLSNNSFTLWNGAGRVFGVDTSVFTSEVAGAFSMLLTLGGIYHLIAPGKDKTVPPRVALAIGLILSVLFVSADLYFRPAPAP